MITLVAKGECEISRTPNVWLNITKMIRIKPDICVLTLTSARKSLLFDDVISTG